MDQGVEHPLRSRPTMIPSFLVRAIRPLALLASLFASAAGCARLPAYERGQLAHPTMTTSDLARSSEEHTRAVHEGATGGGFAAGGGCGCN